MGLPHRFDRALTERLARERQETVGDGYTKMPSLVGPGSSRRLSVSVASLRQAPHCTHESIPGAGAQRPPRTRGCPVGAPPARTPRADRSSTALPVLTLRRVEFHTCAASPPTSCAATSAA